jgi:hypothetical protein
LDIKCFFFVFGIFLHPREGKKKASAKQDLLGGGNGVLLPHYEGFLIFNLPYLQVIL